MRAVVCQNETLRVAEMPAPVPGAEQVLLATERCGICGSDLHARTHSDELADVAAEIGYATAMRPEQEIVFGVHAARPVRPAVALHKEIEFRFVFGYDPGDPERHAKILIDPESSASTL